MESLAYLGIYESEILDAIKTADEALQRENINADICSDYLYEELEQTGKWDDITNSIIGAYFRITADLINQKRKSDDYATYYVNGLDSHFYLNHEEVYVS